MRYLYEVETLVKQCSKNWQNVGRTNVTVLPKIKITSPEQFVPLHLALDYFSSNDKLSNYYTYLETLRTKPEASQQRVIQAFTNMWLREISSKTLTEYNEVLYEKHYTNNSEIALGKKLYRINFQGQYLSKLGLFITFYTHNYYTLESRQFSSVKNSLINIRDIYYLVVVKAKVLPLIATALLLQQSYKLDAKDIKIFWNPSLPEVQSSVKIKQTFPEAKKQGIEIIETTTGEMMKYLVGEQEEKTNEQLLEGARKILEEEMVFA